MSALNSKIARPQPDFSSCSGCSLCLLVCPVWRRAHDLRLTPHGRAKALQNGVPVIELKDSIDSCTLCGACEPVCPENIGLVEMVMGLRRELPPSMYASNLHRTMQAEKPLEWIAPTAAGTILLAGGTIIRRQALLARVSSLLGGAGRMPVASDPGADIALALEIGALVPPQRLERFLAPLRPHKTIIVTDGLLFSSLRRWLPGSHIVSLGRALSALAPLRHRLRPDDLYVIEARAYHADFEALVTYYDDLRHATGCSMNLDLQRIAIPATARNLRQRLGFEAINDAEQSRWMLQGRRIARIVVESVNDLSTLRSVSDLPVVLLAELEKAENADHV